MKSTLTQNQARLLYVSESDKSITSLSKVIDGRTTLYFDDEIGHTYTAEIENIDKYYDEEYHIYDESDEDDVLYKVVDGVKIFRQQHQLDVLQRKISIEPGMNILDYGCAKGTVLKRLSSIVPGINPHLFDVSQMYTHLWKNFIPVSNFSSYQVKSEWVGKMQLITSFFAFEHTPDPIKELTTIQGLLSPDGYVYMIVPNMYENTGDFIVADHIHHYSKPSLRYLFQQCGLEILEIDEKSHFAAFIIVAKNTQGAISVDSQDDEVQRVKGDVEDIAGYWSGMQTKIQVFESISSSKTAAIYGAGVYGMFIASTLKKFDNVKLFIDQNPLLINSELLGVPVFSPDKYDVNFEVLYVGLNPLIAKEVISKLQLPEHVEVFYL
ncbi:MAG: methyltransferase domain-containing protein [Bacteroidota bacterium]